MKNPVKENGRRRVHYRRVSPEAWSTDDISVYLDPMTEFGASKLENRKNKRTHCTSRQRAPHSDGLVHTDNVLQGRVHLLQVGGALGGRGSLQGPVAGNERRM